MADVRGDDFQHGGAYVINIVVDDAEERLAITMSCQLSVFANSKLDNEATQYLHGFGLRRSYCDAA